MEYMEICMQSAPVGGGGGVPLHVDRTSVRREPGFILSASLLMNILGVINRIDICQILHFSRLRAFLRAPSGKASI